MKENQSGSVPNCGAESQDVRGTFANAGSANQRALPKRIQRKRTRGWKMPANTVYVGRGTAWGNPYTVEKHGRDEAVALYRQMLAGRAFLRMRRELRGKNLACWCALDKPCHADVLLEFANGT